MLQLIVNNISAVLKTDDKALLKALGKKYSCKVPGYQYVAAYKRGHWRGEKEFFSPKSGKFGSGLLYSVCKDLDYIDREYEIIDSRTPLDLKSYGIPSINLRGYQEELVLSALDLKGCIIKAPTGSGKTIVLASILKACENLTGLIFFTKKQLLHQTYQFLQEHGIDVGVAFGDGVDIKPITLCTIQSVDKVLDSHLKTSDFIIFDEIHEFAKGKLSGKVIKSFPKARIRIGMTATPPSEKFAKLNLVSYLGEIIEEATAEDLIEEGFLTPPEIRMVDLPKEDWTDKLDKSYMEIYEDDIIKNVIRNEIIAKIANSLKKKNNKTLVLTKNLEHAKTLHELIPNAFKLEGKDSLVDRDKILSEFRKTDEPVVIIGTVIFQTGVDIPELTHLINARGLKSEIATIQALGRALRKHSNKTKVFIYDFIDKSPYLEAHAKARMKAYKNLNFNITVDGTYNK